MSGAKTFLNIFWLFRLPNCIHTFFYSWPNHTYSYAVKTALSDLIWSISMCWPPTRRPKCSPSKGDGSPGGAPRERRVTKTDAARETEHDVQVYGVATWSIAKPEEMPVGRSLRYELLLGSWNMGRCWGCCWIGIIVTSVSWLIGNSGW